MIKLLLKFWPVLVPFACYALWWFFVARRTEGEEILSPWQGRVWFITLGAALLMALLCLVWVAFTSDAEREGVYVPAHMDDSGELVPGRIVPHTGE